MSVDETADNIAHMELTKLPKSEKSVAIAKPHPDFWYPGGSVILEVGNTKFKLYRSILQRLSAYLSSLFQKEAEYLEVEKGIPNLTIPVYRVSETTADDFATLLAWTKEPMCISTFHLISANSNGLLNSVRGVMQKVHSGRLRGALMGSYSACCARLVV